MATIRTMASKDNDRLSLPCLCAMSELIMRGKTVAEAAEILAVSQAAIKKNLQEARNLLKVCAPEAVKAWINAKGAKTAFHR